jgi:cyclopropane fatty-acyl-phospholipid synthase-like methyltransferase
MPRFDEMYRGSPPPWDIGRPQPALEELEGAGEIVGRVIDLGCGTGENSCYLASRGHPVRGVDSAPTAIARARDKAKARGLRVDFDLVDAFALGAPSPPFDVVLDCGLFHTFSDAERPRYVAAARGVLRPGGRMFLLCFSDREPNWGGPRRVTEAELRAAFAHGWHVRYLRASRFATNMEGVEGRAWLASLERSGA